MTYSYTTTATYTTTDINRVIDYFTADFDMFSQSTGLRSRENVKLIAEDIRRKAISGYLDEINLYLDDEDGKTIRAAKYKIYESAYGSSDKPSNSLWPRCPNGSLGVYVINSRKWWDLSDSQREKFQADNKVKWGTGDLDTSFPTLSQKSQQNYSSNSYGLKKTMFV